MAMRAKSVTYDVPKAGVNLTRVLESLSKYNCDFLKCSKTVANYYKYVNEVFKNDLKIDKQVYTLYLLDRGMNGSRIPGKLVDPYNDEIAQILKKNINIDSKYTRFLIVGAWRKIGFWVNTRLDGNNKLSEDELYKLNTIGKKIIREFVKLMKQSTYERYLSMLECIGC